MSILLMLDNNTDGREGWFDTRASSRGVQMAIKAVGNLG